MGRHQLGAVLLGCSALLCVRQFTQGAWTGASARAVGPSGVLTVDEVDDDGPGPGTALLPAPAREMTYAPNFAPDALQRRQPEWAAVVRDLVRQIRDHIASAASAPAAPNLPPVVAIYVRGSVAAGRARAFASDVDLFVIFGDGEGGGDGGGSVNLHRSGGRATQAQLDAALPTQYFVPPFVREVQTTALRAADARRGAERYYMQLYATRVWPESGGVDILAGLPALSFCDVVVLEPVDWGTEHDAAVRRALLLPTGRAAPAPSAVAAAPVPLDSSLWALRQMLRAAGHALFAERAGLPGGGAAQPWMGRDLATVVRLARGHPRARALHPALSRLLDAYVRLIEGRPWPAPVHAGVGDSRKGWQAGNRRARKTVLTLEQGRALQSLVEGALRPLRRFVRRAARVEHVRRCGT